MSTQEASRPSPSPRLACVQAGDYGEAKERLAAGGAETYGHQRYTVDAFERFVAGLPHQVLSVHAPPGTRQVGLAEYSGISQAGFPGLPGRWKAALQARSILRMLERFGPTHLLLRFGDVIGCRVLQWSARRGIPTAVLIASRFSPSNPTCREFCSRANDPGILWVANHSRVATASLVECGLRPEKAVAWDYPSGLTPDRSPVKESPGAGPLRVVFAGMLIKTKGVLDLVEAVSRVRGSVPALRLVLCGDGELRAGLQAHPGVKEGWLEVPGLVNTDRVQALMREAWVVVVPTHPSYPEALPLVITESLTARTPVLLSDHPIFQGFFKEGEGVRFFRAEDPASLAETLSGLIPDRAGYAALSEKTAGVWQSLQIETKFHHLLDRLAKEWKFPAR